MTLADLIKDFIDSTKERLKTPISGAFLWSFIVYNWRPIFLLIFSEASIENKIVVINYEYCSFWAIFWPLVIATFYTLLIPKIMLLIDIDLAPTKNERVTKRYQAKKHEVKEKTSVAKEEFLLKSEESGNQTIQEFMSQIDALKENNNSLQDSIKQINESNKVTVDGLNTSLKAAKEAMSEKETQITRLRRINDIVYENGSNIHIQDDDALEYTRLVKRILNNSKLEKELISKVVKISDTLLTKDFATIEKIKVNTKNEILVGDLNDFQALDNLYIKSVVARRISNNKVTYIFTEAGGIIYNIFLAKVKVSH